MHKVLVGVEPELTIEIDQITHSGESGLELILDTSWKPRLIKDSYSINRGKVYQVIYQLNGKLPVLSSDYECCVEENKWLFLLSIFIKTETITFSERCFIKKARNEYNIRIISELNVIYREIKSSSIQFEEDKRDHLTFIINRFNTGVFIVKSKRFYNLNEIFSEKSIENIDLGVKREKYWENDMKLLLQNDKRKFLNKNIGQETHRNIRFFDIETFGKKDDLIEHENDIYNKEEEVYLVLDKEIRERGRTHRNEHKPYLIGYSDYRGRICQSYNEKDNTFDEFILKMFKMDQTVIYYTINGCKFDHFLLLGLLSKEYQLSGVIISNGRIAELRIRAPFSMYKMKKSTDSERRMDPSIYGEIIFKDFTLIVPFSLKELGKTVNRSQKGELNYVKIGSEMVRNGKLSKKTKIEVNEYFKMDLLTTKDAVIVYRRKFLAINIKIETFLTLAQMSKFIFLRDYNTNNIKIYEDDIFDFCNKAIYGGSVNCFIKYNKNSTKVTSLFEVKKEVKKACHSDENNEPSQNDLNSDESIFPLDVNSLYPAVMMEEEYPVGECEEMAYSVNELINLIKSGEFLFISEVEIMSPDLITQNIYPYNENDYRIQKCIKAHLTSVSLKTHLSYGYKLLKVFKTIVWKYKSAIFKDFVNHFYEARLKSTDSVEKTVYKLILNSLYGKTIQNYEKARNTFIFDEKNKEWTINSDKNNNFSIGPNYLGAFILSYAKSKMSIYLQLCGAFTLKPDIYYTDTDSLYVNSNGYRILKEKGYLDDKKLGLLKCEIKENEEIVFFITFGPKQYIYYKKNKITGVIEEIIKWKGIREIGLKRIISAIKRGEGFINVRITQFKRIGGSIEVNQVIKKISLSLPNGLIKIKNSNIIVGEKNKN